MKYSIGMIQMNKKCFICLTVNLPASVRKAGVNIHSWPHHSHHNTLGRLIPAAANWSAFYSEPIFSNAEKSQSCHPQWYEHLKSLIIEMQNISINLCRLIDMLDQTGLEVFSFLFFQSSYLALATFVACAIEFNCFFLWIDSFNMVSIEEKDWLLFCISFTALKINKSKYFNK